MRKKWNTELFIEAANEIHNGLFDYSSSIYTGMHNAISIICPHHGVFSQTAHNHIVHTAGCQKCARALVGSKTALSQEEFIARIHPKLSGLDFSSSVYQSKNTPLTVMCQVHGEFLKTPKALWLGRGCPKCKLSARKASFIKKAMATHGDAYDYADSTYTYNSVDINCPKHGVFRQRSSDHIQGTGCPKCTHHRSRGEETLANILDALGVDYVIRDRTVINPKELDIYIPSLNLAFEFNGLYYHSTAVRSEADARKLHKQKTDLAALQGVRVVHIYQDVLSERGEAVNLLLGKLTNKVPSIGARKLTLRELPLRDANMFLNTAHIQGGVSTGLCIGLYDEDLLVGVAVFSKRKSARGMGCATVYELTRFTSTMRIVGGLQRVIAFFKGLHPECTAIVSYVDLSVFTGAGYVSAGFTLTSINAPDYKVIEGNFLNRRHKSNYTRNKLAKRLKDFDPSLSERENCLAHRIYRVYDCGMAKYTLNF